MEAKSQTSTIEVVGPQPLYTIGYEGLRPDGMVSALQSNSIDVLVDVRQRAASRSPGFAKTALRDALTDAGIRYEHLPLLGTPADLRVQLRASEIQIDRYLQLYREHLDSHLATVVELEQLVAANRCCLLCLEADHRVCHRTVLSNLLVERSGGQLSVHHIAIER